MENKLNAKVEKILKQEGFTQTNALGSLYREFRNPRFPAFYIEVVTDLEARRGFNVFWKVSKIRSRSTTGFLPLSHLWTYIICSKAKTKEAILKQCPSCGYSTAEYLLVSEVTNCLVCRAPMQLVTHIIESRAVRMGNPLARLVE